MRKISHPSHRLTTTGYYVAGVKRMFVPSLNRSIYVGQVVENPQGERLPVMQHGEWESNGNTINQDFGDLIN